ELAFARRLVDLGDRLAVQLERAQRHLLARAPDKALLLALADARRLEQLHRYAILQRQQIADGAVDLGAASDLPRLDGDEARGQAYAVAHALIGAGDDQAGAEQRAHAHGGDGVQLGLLGLQILLGDHLIDRATLDHAQPRHVLE